MLWQIRDVEIAANFIGETFSLTGDDGAECFEGVDTLKYLGRVLYWTDDDWPSVLRNIWRARKFWGRLGKLLRQEVADPIISARFYRVVVQAVLLFGAETWVVLAAMLNKIKGVNVGFLRQVMEMKAQRIGDETCTQEGPDRVLQAAGTKPIREYINKRQATMEDWVDLRPISEVYEK